MIEVADRDDGQASPFAQEQAPRMKQKQARSHSNADAPVALNAALEKSHDVKEKVEACAEDLGAANDSMKKSIEQGVTTLPAGEALQKGVRVEAKVQECADDLGEVTDTLAQGIQDLEKVEIALTRSRAALVETKTALATAQAEEKQATLRAMHDAATGLPNRGLFDDRLAHGIALAERNRWTLAVMFIDLDRFKIINDEHGHATGDRVLKEVADRLQRFARDDDTVCRNGGDEFLVLLMNPKGRANVRRVATALHEEIARPMEIDGVERVVGVSVGIALYPSDGTAGDQLVELADTAMYRAKKGAAGCVFYGSEKPGSAG